MGTQTRLRRSSGLSIVYVTLPWSRRVMAPPPCCGCGIVSLPVVWSLCPCHGLRVCGMVSLPVAWSPCPWRGLFAHGVVFVSVAWSLCPCHGLRVLGVVSLPVAWSPWPCLASAASPLVFLPPTCRWVFSLLKIGLQSESSCTAHATDIDCTDLTPCTKFPEVTPWA